MTLQFEETTPGVHMAMWETPNSGNARTVVIIESLGQFTLYIDGDVAARDLDSFEAAATRAQSMLTSGGSRRMVQMAGALAVFIAVGGAAIGLTHLLSSTSGIATAVTAQTQSIVKDVTSKPTQVAETQFTTFKPVQPRKQPVVVSKVEPTSTTASVPTSPVKPIVVNSTIPAPTAQAEAKIETAPSPATVSKTAKAEIEPTTEAAGPRIFSATRPVFAGAPEKQPEAKVVTNPVVTAAPVKTEEQTLAAVEAPKPAAPQEVAIKDEPSTEVGSFDQPRAAIDPEALPLPNRNPSAQFAAAGTENSEARFVPVPAAPAPQVAPNPYQNGTKSARQGRSADTAYESLMERAAAKRRAKLEKRRRALKTKKYTKKKVVKTKRYTKKKHRTVRRRSRRVMRCLSTGCRWVARNGYYDRQYRRGHY